MIYSKYNYSYIDYKKIDYKKIDYKKIIPWIGTVLQVIGAVLVSIKFLGVGFLFFTGGSAIWLVIAIARNDNPLTFLQSIFLTTNIIGLYNYL